MPIIEASFVTSRHQHQQQHDQYKRLYFMNIRQEQNQLLIQSPSSSSSTIIRKSLSSSSSSSSSSQSSPSSTFPFNNNWSQIAKDVFSTDTRPIILFDGICNLCNAGVNFALDHDPQGYFRFVSLQSKIGQALLIRSGKSPTDISSIVLVTQDTAYFKADAVVRIASKLNGGGGDTTTTTTTTSSFTKFIPLLIRILDPIVPTTIKNATYDFVARNRYLWMGKMSSLSISDSCRLWDDNFENRFIPDP